MFKKDHEMKTPKSRSKQSNKTGLSKRERGFHSHKQLPETRDNTQLGELQRRLNQEINARKDSFSELMKMIVHLQETKKSKIPTPKGRFLSPSCRIKEEPEKVYSNKLTEIKNQLNELKEQQYQENKYYIKKMQQEVQNFRLNDENNKQFIINVGKFMQDFRQYKLQISQKISIKNKSIDLLTVNFSQHQQKMQLIQEQIKNTNLLINNLSKVLQFQNKPNTLQFKQSKTERNHQFIQRLQQHSQISWRISNQLEQITNKFTSKVETIRESLQIFSEGVNEMFDKVSTDIYNNASQSESILLILQKLSRQNENAMREVYLQKRLQSLERRMDIIYKEYLNISTPSV